MSMNSVGGVYSAGNTAAASGVKQEASLDEVAPNNEYTALDKAKTNEDDMQGIENDDAAAKKTDRKQVAKAAIFSGLGGAVAGFVIGSLICPGIGGIIGSIIGAGGAGTVGGVLANKNNKIDNLESEVAELQEEIAQEEESKKTLEEKMNSSFRYIVQGGDTASDIWNDYKSKGINVGDYETWCNDFLELNSDKTQNINEIVAGEEYRIPTYD